MYIDNNFDKMYNYTDNTSHHFKGEDEMNTKDYIENKKCKKLSNILKGALATGLVVGSMVTSTACKPNQPHETTSTTSSSTSTIETTNTSVTIQPSEEAKAKQLELKDLIDKKFKDAGENFESLEKLIMLSKFKSSENDMYYQCYMTSFNNETGLFDYVGFANLNEEEYNYLASYFNLYNNENENANDFLIRFSNDFTDNYSYINKTTKNINEIDDEKVLDIILDSFSKSHSQDQQDDLVR